MKDARKKLDRVSMHDLHFSSTTLPRVISQQHTIYRLIQGIKNGIIFREVSRKKQEQISHYRDKITPSKSHVILML